MEAIKKIYEAMTLPNRPPLPRAPSGPEEMSTEDQGLFTPPQLPFEQSSSGNGGPSEIRPTGEGGSGSKYEQGQTEVGGENERPTFD